MRKRNMKIEVGDLSELIEFIAKNLNAPNEDVIKLLKKAIDKGLIASDNKGITLLAGRKTIVLTPELTNELIKQIRQL
jgi:hypothetical protein